MIIRDTTKIVLNCKNGEFYNRGPGKFVFYKEQLGKDVIIIEFWEKSFDYELKEKLRIPKEILIKLFNDVLDNFQTLDTTILTERLYEDRVYSELFVIILSPCNMNEYDIVKLTSCWKLYENTMKFRPDHIKKLAIFYKDNCHKMT